MSFRAALRQRHVLPIASAALTSAVLLQGQAAYAEDSTHIQDTQRHLRKPIYDDPEPTAPSSSRTPPQPQPTQNSSSSSVLSSLFGSSEPSQPAATASPTPTDRLAAHVRTARLALYGYSVDSERALNGFLTRTLRLERDFTATVAGLAPPPTANEPVLPGLIYTGVAALAGSIVTRSRGILLRASVPLAFGLTAAYATLPYTMRNVEDLASSYEDNYPQLKRVHGDLRERAQHIYETGKAHSAMTVARGEEALAGARKSLEDWVRQGK